MADHKPDPPLPRLRYSPASPPSRYAPIHNGYYSDEERGKKRDRPSPMSMAPRIPSPPRRTRHSSEWPKVPPAAARAVDEERSSSSYWSVDPRVPSPPPSTRKSSFRGSRGPAAPPAWPAPRTETRYLSPVDGTERTPSRNGRTQGLRRWNSDRAPRPRGEGSADSREPIDSKDSTSLNPSNTTLLSSASGILGDKAYQYRPLGELEFRIVRVHPAKKTMIVCDILHYSMEDPPEYVAISYAWGDAGNTRKIELEGSQIPISISLHGALEAVRQRDASVLVWADALCIDQQNRDERGIQVRLMTNIYSMASSVAVWLGPEEDGSATAIEFLGTLTDKSSSADKFSDLITSQGGRRGLAAVVTLFDRDYWRRLWAVQEVMNATSITVYCGSTKLPWGVYQQASDLFDRYRNHLDFYFPGGQRHKRRSGILMSHFSYSQVLVYQGPGSLPDLTRYTKSSSRKEDALLEVLRACRRKLASDPKDKVFGILGVLPEEVRKDFRADYSRSVKEVYTEVVDYIIRTTERLDVICDAIHFPLHTSSFDLPSYVPDWSHIPQTTAMCHRFGFDAGGAKAEARFLDERLNKLEISAVYLDTIDIHGVAVGTLCKLGDYLMAFLHWRALLLGTLEGKTAGDKATVQEEFCRTLSLGQMPSEYRPDQWMNVCYRVFASLIRDRLPHMPLPRDLAEYLNPEVDIGPEPRDLRKFLQKHFGDRMMGRCFCRTEEDRIGMGTGFMQPGDVVVVPLGCSTPILLRPEGIRGEYRFVGDVYIFGYMYGRAVDHWKEGKKKCRKYVLH